ncbi:NAD(P)-binding protein [Mytilinidion resinicola]|uniref:NAD(P)-binding protein n=1 Tax=Mytilinidion resinicola TaxID=574789 RepID=A0A6A6YVF4_9PEZI|nr:NAD(P)-binding protein [Mytilinidion resinicola]KAF2812740.1 NAD(P)-binding protein [Mytilinidion resinicola]
MGRETPLTIDESKFKNLAGKTILITGASSGIGLETANYFYKLGANVAFLAGRKRPATDVPLDSDRTLLRNIDVSNWEQQVEAFEATVKKFGHIDIVLPNAGVNEPRQQFFNLKTGESGKLQPLETKVIDVDLKGTAYTTALGIHYLKEKGGSIIIMSSMAGYVGVDEMPAYAATKHGATALLRSLYKPAAAHKIAISLSNPALVFTPGSLSEMYAPGEEAYQAAKKQLAAMGVKMSSAFTVTLSVAYLASLGMEASGVGLLVENDEIHDWEAGLQESLPGWFKVKAGGREGMANVSD